MLAGLEIWFRLSWEQAQILSECRAPIVYVALIYHATKYSQDVSIILVSDYEQDTVESRAVSGLWS